jgi:alkanesulfonate monooxygenase SsuD/methylene tetrahydromethanopterin reductase-like flavin-dependent oxidoreductase (luciferase family)
MGGHAEPVLKRAARLADGWLPGYKSVEDALPALDKLDQYLEQSGRKRSGRFKDGDFGTEVRLPYGGGNLDVWKKLVDGWQEVGATHLSFNPLNAGLNSPEDHIRSVRLFAEMVEIR